MLLGRKCVIIVNKFVNNCIYVIFDFDWLFLRFECDNLFFIWMKNLFNFLIFKRFI